MRILYIVNEKIKNYILNVLRYFFGMRMKIHYRKIKIMLANYLLCVNISHFKCDYRTAWLP